MGSARTIDECGLDIKKSEDRTIDGKRIRYERIENRRGARIATFGR